MRDWNNQSWLLLEYLILNVMCSGQLQKALWDYETLFSAILLRNGKNVFKKRMNQGRRVYLQIVSCTCHRIYAIVSGC